jgi:hypothetical protein
VFTATTSSSDPLLVTHLVPDLLVFIDDDDEQGGYPFHDLADQYDREPPTTTSTPLPRPYRPSVDPV